MLESFVGLYALILWLLFKKFKLIPVNLWTVVTSIFLFMAVLGFGMIWMGRYQPVTHQSQTFVISTPIVAEVQGRVTEVVSDGGEPLKKGDVLFKIDPTPYQAQVDSIQAQLTLAETRLKQEQELADQGAGNGYDLDSARSSVDRLRADLQGAQFKLDATTVVAPADGYASQVLIRPGQMVTPLAFNRVMVFIHDEGPYLAAGFAQNKVQYIDPGDEAEVAFAATPGRVFKAKVVRVQPVLSEGTMMASGRLISLDNVRPGSLPVLLEIEDDLSGYPLPAGSTGMTTVYTGKMHHLNIVRKIILRIKSWEYWVFAPGASHGGGGGGGH